MLKVLLVDDEPPALQLLRQYLEAYPQLIIVGEANNGVDAVRLAHTYTPDLIFLDIQMPGLTGLEVLQHLEQLPQVIFATAYDQYALEAFDRNAVDYLLKPYTQQRFARAVDRVLAAQQGNLAQVQALTESLLAANAPKQYPPKILVPAGNRIAALDPADVVRVEADGDYAHIVVAERAYLSSQGIGQLTDRLDPRSFVRVHRSSLVNLRHVSELSRDGGNYTLTMSNGDRVRVSRGYAEAIRTLVV